MGNKISQYGTVRGDSCVCADRALKRSGASGGVQLLRKGKQIMEQWFETAIVTAFWTFTALAAWQDLKWGSIHIGDSLAGRKICGCIGCFGQLEGSLYSGLCCFTAAGSGLCRDLSSFPGLCYPGGRGSWGWFFLSGCRMLSGVYKDSISF